MNKGIFVDGVKAVWHDDVISSKMRETMLVGGKLSSRSPHYEGSEKRVGPFLMTLWRSPLPQSEPT